MPEWIESLRSSWIEHWADWALFGGYLIGTWLVAGIARRITRGVLPRLTARTGTTLDDRLANRAERPVHQVAMALGLQLSLQVLGKNIPSIGAATAFDWAQKGVSALVVLAVTNLINGMARTGIDWYVQEHTRGNEQTWQHELLPVVRRVMSLVLYFIAISIILKHFGHDITALVTTAGVASLAVALAAQETLSNMLGGFAILVDRPFKLGDTIELADGRVGDVIEIGIRSTRIKLPDGTALVVPNKDMANTRLINYALPTQSAAVRITLGVDYRSDIQQVKRVLLGVVAVHEDVLVDPAPAVFFTRFGPYALEVLLVCWVGSYKNRFRVTDEINTAILKAFRAEGITLPFPQQTVHLVTGNEGKTLENGET